MNLTINGQGGGREEREKKCEQIVYLSKNGTNFRIDSEQDSYVESTLLIFSVPKYMKKKKTIL